MFIINSICIYINVYVYIYVYAIHIKTHMPCSVVNIQNTKLIWLLFSRSLESSWGRKKECALV